jgi:hypothetical protein
VQSTWRNTKVDYRNINRHQNHDQPLQGLNADELIIVAICHHSSGCQDNNNVGMISVSSMLMFSMQYNMRVFYRNSSSDSEGHMCCDGRREAGSLSSEGQHNKPTTGFRHVDLLRLSSSVGSWLASPSAPSCSAARQILIKRSSEDTLKTFLLGWITAVLHNNVM